MMYSMVCNSVGSSEIVVPYLYSTLSQHLQQYSHEEPASLHVNTQRNGELLDRMVKVGCRATRQYCVLAHLDGEYVAPHPRYVYCPTILS